MEVQEGGGGANPLDPHPTGGGASMPFSSPACLNVLRTLALVSRLSHDLYLTCIFPDGQVSWPFWNPSPTDWGSRLAACNFRPDGQVSWPFWNPSPTDWGSRLMRALTCARARYARTRIASC